MKTSDSLFGQAELSQFETPQNEGEKIVEEPIQSSTQSKKEPLAYRMRPASLEEYVGQEHILGKDGILRRAIERDLISSIILYGPPGTGKTTLASIIASHTKASFGKLNAVLQGVQQIREEVEKAVQTRKHTSLLTKCIDGTKHSKTLSSPMLKMEQSSSSERQPRIHSSR